MGRHSRSLISLAIVAVCLVAFGCASAPEEYKAVTRTYPDGFFVRQVTYVPAGWNSNGREYESFCLRSQLVQSQIDGKWYCPPDNSIDMLKTKISMAETSHVQPYKEMVMRLFGDVAIGGGIGAGLAAQKAAKVTQSVTSSVGGSPIKTSTLVIDGPIPPGVAK
jgi:hypothetical protein